MNQPEKFFTLPKNQDDLDKFSEIGKTDEDARKLLCMIEDSVKLKRCLGKTIILLNGYTNVGKSSLVNHLFKGVFANVTSERKGTDRTVEYVVTSDDPTLHIKNNSLGLVDTPGFGDEDGEEQDIRNITSIKTFFHQHNCIYPNLILLVFKASNNRILGPETDFCKTLKAFKYLELVDVDHPNVLVVFTYACSVAGHTFTNSSDGSAMWSEFRKLYNHTLKMFACYLKIIPSVVFVENQAEAYGLPVDGNSEWKILPCGTRQLLNVFEAMLDMLKGNGDNLAAATISQFFREKRQLNPVEELSVTASEDDDLNDDEEALYAKLFPEDESNPIQQVLMKSNLDKDLHEERDYLADIFIENGVKEIKEIKNKTFNDIARILYPYSIGPKALSVLKKCNLVPELPGRYLNQSFKDLKIGMGYDIYHDKVLDQAIYLFDASNWRYTTFGISIPNEVILRNHDKAITKQLVFDDKQGYVNYRLNELGAECNVKESDFDLKVKSGYNISKSKITFRKEECLFSLTLKKYEAKVTQEFEKALNNIPRNPKYNMDRMIKFFSEWGHFVVVKVYGGGLIEGRNKKNEDSLPSIDLNSLSWHGGVQPDNKMNVEEMIRDWKESLRNHPIIIDSQMELKPMWKVVQELACEDNQYEVAYNSIKLAQEMLLKSHQPPNRTELAGSVVSRILRTYVSRVSAWLFREMMKDEEIFGDMDLLLRT